MLGTAPWGINALRNRRGIMLTALVVASALGLAACSSGSSSPSSTTTAGTAVSASTLASLRATLDQAEAAPAFAAPGPQVNASVLQGKSVLVMPVNSQIDACSTQAQDFQALGKQLGLNVTIYNDTGVPTQWMAGIEAATADRDQAIVGLCGIVPQLVSSQLQAAHQAGLSFIDGNYNETNYYTGLDGETAVNTTQGITDDVDEAILNQNGKPMHALVVTSPSIIQGPAGAAAATSAVQAACPNVCSVENLSIPIQNWATSTQSEVQQELVAHPDINAVIIVFDGIVQFAYNAVASMHRPGLEIYTWGGSRTVEAYMLEHGSLIAADPGPDEQWDAWEAMDQTIRLLSGKPAASVNNEVAPNRFWTPDNVAQFFGPAGTYGNRGFDDGAFINGFFTLWGVPPSSSAFSAFSTGSG
jgi:ABC-type sugar transport system substrate-binding protein